MGFVQFVRARIILDSCVSLDGMYVIVDFASELALLPKLMDLGIDSFSLKEVLLPRLGLHMKKISWLQANL